MEEMRIVFAGFGGQGLLFAGKVVAYAGMIDDRELSWMPSYGPEMRGGTASCSVTISDEPIGSPLILDPTILVAMNQPSIDKFIDAVVPGGLVLADTTLIAHLPERDDVKIIPIEATRIAEENGLKGLANIVLVGKLLAETQFCSVETIAAGIRKAVPASKSALIEKNLEAIEIGLKL